MKQSMIKKQVVLSVGTLVFAGVGMAWAAPAPSELPSVRIKIDLAIPPTAVSVTKTGVAGTNHQVRIDATVVASSMSPVCSGPFKVKLESTEDPTTGRWALVGEAGVADLCIKAGAAMTPSAKRSFTDTVPQGALRKYRATADSLNQVDEMNEGNNVANAGYVAR
jgi:hypothetical protein